MASQAKTGRSSNPGQRETSVKEGEGLSQKALEQEIRNRAYFIYLQRGGQPGHDTEDWLQAERELSSNSSATARQSAADEVR